MSKSPKFLVGVGISKSPSVPDQNYKELRTRFNIGGFGGNLDKDFYNKIIKEKEKSDIYGFMGGECKYTYDYSIQYIADFFQKHNDIKVVVCDVLHTRKLFQCNQYNHPQVPKNIPFFVRESVLTDINFTSQEAPLQHQLETLKKTYTIFHIAFSLISIREEDSP